MEIDLSRLDGRTRSKVDDIFRRDFDLKVLKAIERQTRIAARNHLHRPRAKDGFGERTLEIDATVDGIWRQFYGHGYSEDKDLVKFLVKRNPEIAVKSRGTKIQVGYQAGRNSRKPVGIVTGANGENREQQQPKES